MGSSAPPLPAHALPPLPAGPYIKWFLEKLGHEGLNNMLGEHRGWGAVAAGGTPHRCSCATLLTGHSRPCTAVEKHQPHEHETASTSPAPAGWAPCLPHPQLASRTRAPTRSASSPTRPAPTQSPSPLWAARKGASWRHAGPRTLGERCAPGLLVSHDGMVTTCCAALTAPAQAEVMLRHAFMSCVPSCAQVGPRV